MSASCQDWPEIFHQTRVSVTTFSCTQIRLCLDAIVTLNSSAERSPPSESHVCQSAPLDQRAKFEKASEGCRETGEGGKFSPRWGWAGALRRFPFSLCVKFFRVVCSLVIALCWQDGREWGWERHIINQECFYNKAQSLSNPTHSHTAVSD